MDMIRIRRTASIMAVSRIAALYLPSRAVAAVSLSRNFSLSPPDTTVGATTSHPAIHSNNNFNIRDELYKEGKGPICNIGSPDLPPLPPAASGLSSFVPFRQLIEMRRRQAKRSLIVQIKSKYSAEDLFMYCTSNFGRVAGMHFHQNQNNSVFSDFYVVEFENTDSVQKSFQLCHHNRDSVAGASIPVYSPFLWFSGNGSTTDGTQQTIPVYLPVHQEQIFTDIEVMEKVERAKSLDDEIMEFYNSTKMSDTSSRIRFLACEQIELAISGMFPKAEVLPFGSSVNTYGRHTSDLDMIITLDSQKSSAAEEKYPSSRLIFHAKGGLSGGQRSQVQRYCDQFSNIVQSFLPGCQNVQNILHARVPIVKYQQQLLGLECDLSMTSMSGHYMSELLYLYGELDSRVRPLVFVIRKWARQHGLDERPTSYFTNFTLTIMVIFYLQTQHGMLPSYRVLHSLARPEDYRLCDDGVDCTFIRDVSGLEGRLNACIDKPEPSISELLLGFFDYYGKFDYKRSSVCILTGQVQPKRSAKQSQKHLSFFLDSTNPLEPDLNVSCNIQEHAVNKFKNECRLSHGLLLAMLEEKSRLFDLFDGSGKPRLNVRVASLDWSSDQSPNDEVKRVNEAPPLPKVVGDGRRSEKRGAKADKQSEDKRQETVRKKSRIPKVREFFQPKF